MMLPEDSFLRRLPAILDPVGRIRLEALVFASDVLRHAYLSLRDLATRNADGAFTLQDRVALFSFAWTIVDQLHVLRQLIRSIANDTPGPTQTRFLEKSESATLMRNRMDHLSGLVKNLSGQKGSRPPLFGAITYFLVEPKNVKSGSDADGAFVAGGSFVTIAAGSVPEGNALFELGNPLSRPIRPPVSQFILTAFDWSLDIDGTLDTLEVTLGLTAVGVTKMIMEQCEQESARSGIDIAQLVAPMPISSFVLLTEIEFREPPPISAAP